MLAPLQPLKGKDSYEGPLDPVTYLTFDRSASPHLLDEEVTTLVWLAGTGQVPDNELIRRFTNALHSVGLQLVVHALNNKADVESAVQKSNGRVLLGGHSAGGRDASKLVGELSKQYKRIIGLITINPAGSSADITVPVLTVQGENDGGKRLLPDRRWPDEKEMVYVERNGPNMLLIAREGDHSIRYNPGIADKDACSQTRETKAQNHVVAKVVKDFILSCSSSDADSHVELPRRMMVPLRPAALRPAASFTPKLSPGVSKLKDPRVVT
jgi:hypothetical protein